MRSCQPPKTLPDTNPSGNSRPPYNGRSHSLVVLVLIDIEVPELVGCLVWRDDSEEVAELLHLQILLGQVLQIPLREGELWAHRDLGLVAGDGDLVTEVASLAIHLDPILIKLLQLLRLENVVVVWLLAVHDELDDLLLALDLCLLRQALDHHPGKRKCSDGKLNARRRPRQCSSSQHCLSQ